MAAAASTRPSGTKKLVARFGERPVRVRYLYDEKSGRRLKTVELIVEAIPWRPAQKLRELTWIDAKRLGIADRVAGTDIDFPSHPPIGYMPA